MLMSKGILTYSTGQTILTGMAIGSAFIADGIQLLTSAIQKEEKKSAEVEVKEETKE